MTDERVVTRSTSAPKAASAPAPGAPEDAPDLAPAGRPPSGPAGRRMRARLARMATKSQSVNPVLEPLFRAVRANHPKADLDLLERAYLVAERLHAAQMRKSGDP